MHTLNAVYIQRRRARACRAAIAEGIDGTRHSNHVTQLPDPARGKEEEEKKEEEDEDQEWEG